MSARSRLVFLFGPAFVAAIAYVDPGNVAANLTAGAEYGYLLVWVLVLANLMAVIVQYLSAKLGLVTGRSLPQLIGERTQRRGRIAFWAQAEVVAAATDVAEVVGGAIALNILFGTPLLLGGVIVGLVSLGLLAIQSRASSRAFELTIMAFLLIITIGFLAGLVVADLEPAAVLGGLVPRFEGARSVLLAASMLGATVMPHAIYLHSSLTRDRHGVPGSRPVSTRRLLEATRADVLISLVIAGGVNIAMLILAAASLRGVAGTDTIEGAHAQITAHFGPVVGVLFGVGLLASGLASTSVGAYAGSEIMHGLLRVQIPLLLRRAITIIPALALLAFGADPTNALVLSQVVLSLGIPFALVPLLRFTGSPQLMGEHPTARWLMASAWTATVLIIALNLLLVVLEIGAVAAPAS